MIVSPRTRSAEWRSGVAWEEPDCLLCGSDRRTPVLEAADPSDAGRGLRFAVVRCADCGLQYTCPRPDPATIGQFYAADYGPFRRPRLKNRGEPWGPLAAMMGRPCVERRTLPWHGQGRLLDFGCGGGSYLERMRAQGWNVAGLDASAPTAERVRRELGIPCHVGTLPHPDLAPGSFDVVTMWHALEHVHDPLSVLRAAHDLLAPGGRLLIAVPNIASAPARWFGPSWFGLELPRHLTHFTPTTLRAFVEKAGFHFDRGRMVRHSDWLRLSAQLSGRQGRRSVGQRLLTNKSAAKLVAWGCYLTQRADCIFAAGSKDI